ncbi:metallophosphoesterase family protein [cf. Phormidesmis sp. LEGE 11477]|uniref:metallophosphoesterase family protein n=1 Tax=cf. Phormidesmis sp. LEGE 11477 TaxID=1828680 RepID=UPI0018822C77|nr:metallophosphoesterase family protein [cf. Phormidesmis sp. LEGE 11477]MBE9062813.1 serine/threonine protein phosphatase [cf. Phormidesmis sp. LEGE 11477]
MSRRIFIGDVHGHYDGLMRLVSMVSPSSSDTLHFVGDLIDRGPSSSKVVEFVRQGNHLCVLGNHEHLLLNAFPEEDPNLAAFQSWLSSGGQPTLTSYANTEALLEHVQWFKTLPFSIDLGDIFLVHAGLNPRKRLAQQKPIDFCWIRDGFHACPTPFFQDKTIITGHTITFTMPGVAPGKIVRGPGWLDVDTGAYHPKSGWLSAVDIDNDLLYQVNTQTEAERVQSLAAGIVDVEPDRIKPRRNRKRMLELNSLN